MTTSHHEHLKILLVEDDELDAQLLRRSLIGAQSGVQLAHIHDIDDLSEPATAFDAVVLDLTLPSSHGLETVHRALNSLSEIPIIVLTGMSDDQLGVQAVALGAQDYFVKGEVEGQQLWRSLRYAVERGRLRAQMHRTAHEDMLTGLPNRLRFEARLNDAISSCQRTNQRCAVAFIDLDGFKSVNDTHGHNTGDTLLTLVADRLRHALRDEDVPARIGGDEFACLFQNIKEHDGAVAAATRLQHAISGCYNIDTGDAHVKAEIGASVGVAMFPQDARGAEGLLRVADLAMYSAKRSGGRAVRSVLDLA